MGELYKERESILEKIEVMAKTIEAEKRERNEAEESEYRQLRSRLDAVEMLIVASKREHKPEPGKSLSDQFREALEGSKRVSFDLVRETTKTSDVKGAIPLNIKDVLKPLREGLIIDKLGLPFESGLSGEYAWPVYEAVTASIAGEGVALTPSKVTIDALKASPERIGVAIEYTNSALVQSEGKLDAVVKSELPLAISTLINRILLTPYKITNSERLIGPFAAIALANDIKVATGSAPSEWVNSSWNTGSTYAAIGAKYKNKVKGRLVYMHKQPTFAEILNAKAKVLSGGIDGQHLCWVMTHAMKAILEAAPKDAGSGVMICENDRIAGIPVYCSQYIGEANIGLGDWRYQPMGLFGDMRLVADPYTGSTKDTVTFSLNCEYATTCLRPEAFVLAICNKTDA